MATINEHHYDHYIPKKPCFYHFLLVDLYRFIHFRDQFRCIVRMGLVMLAGATQSWTPAPLFSAFLGRPTISLFLICLGLLYLLSNHPFFSVC
jgi:hypothetical protein